MSPALAAALCALAACGGDTTPPSAEPTAATPTTVAPTPSSSPVGAAGGAASAPVVNTTPAATPGSAPGASSAPPPVAAPATPATPAQTPVTAPATDPAAHKMAMDECGLHTQYAGDEYCIKPPSADKGFQMHIGPTNYDNPEPTYLLQPGEENVINLNTTSGNDKQVNFYFRQYRMRPGSHHVIITSNSKRIGGTQNLARDSPDFGIIPPENEDVGLPLAAHVPINANMHFYNFSDKPMLRELWVNYWYVDPAKVKETANPIFSMTGVTAAVAHSHVVVGATCQITGGGRVLSMAGHRHLNNVRFSAWLTSGGKKSLVFDDYDSEHPGELEFNSIAQNPMPDAAAKTAGGFSGILNVKQGDTFDFECEIVNNTNKNFYGANEAQDDEMCILTGDSVGATVQAGCQPITARKIAE
jgi:hypothetical protein